MQSSHRRRLATRSGQLELSATIGVPRNLCALAASRPAWYSRAYSTRCAINIFMRREMDTVIYSHWSPSLQTTWWCFGVAKRLKRRVWVNRKHGKSDCVGLDWERLYQMFDEKLFAGIIDLWRWLKKYRWFRSQWLLFTDFKLMAKLSNIAKILLINFVLN